MLGTVVATATAKAVEQVEAGEPAPAHPQWWLTVVDEASGEPVGVVMRTAPFAPYPLYVLPLPDGAAQQVAAALVDRGEAVSGLNGALPAVRHLATELARRTGGRAHVHEHTRLHVLDDARRAAGGSGRAATPRRAGGRDAGPGVVPGVPRRRRRPGGPAPARARGERSSTRRTSRRGSRRAGSGCGRTGWAPR